MIRHGTYSIVAVDPQTAEVGVAVQSHWFSVGPIVPWVRPGVGAVAVQSVPELSHGPALLDALAAGEEPQAALSRLLAADDQAAYRQVGVVDAQGRVAVHTGERCIAFAGHQQGESFSVQANMMAATAVWPAMAGAYLAARGPLARRLLAALEAAEVAGGDARGRQSAALKVAPAAGEAWRTIVDIRVDDHPEPVAELGRLLGLADAYALASAADDLASEGRHDEAAARYTAASALAPDSHELLFWAGLAAAQCGDLETGCARVRRAIELHPGWRALLDRLEPDIAPSANALREAL